MSSATVEEAVRRFLRHGLERGPQGSGEQQKRLRRTAGLGNAVAMGEEGDDLRYLGEGTEGENGALSVVGRMSSGLQGAQGGVGDLENGGSEGGGQESHVHLGGAWTHEDASCLSARLGDQVGEHVHGRGWLIGGPALEPRRGEFPQRCDGHGRAVILIGRVPSLVYAQRRLLEAAEESVSNAGGQRRVVASSVATGARIVGETFCQGLMEGVGETLVAGCGG